MFKHLGNRVGSGCTLSVLCLAFGCTGADPSGSSTDEDELLGSTTSTLGTSAPVSGCDITTAGGGWTNSFIPQSTEGVTLTFRAYPSGLDARGLRLIDGVIGLSNGPATSFSKLGPIVRFNPNGSIDARNGSSYVGSFPYLTGQPYEIQMSVDIKSHKYTVWVKHADATGKPFELLASDMAFRTEQSAVTRLDNVGRFIDSPTGSLKTCGFLYEAPERCTVSRAGSWASRAFPTRTGLFRLEFDALPASVDGAANIDAVIGAAKGIPTGFAGLAAIVRFRPDGTLDARNGAAYAADAVFHYANNTAYHIVMDIDAARGRYSVSVKDPMVYPPETPPTILAQDYQFRTGQTGTKSFDNLGQFVDGTSGTVYVCSLTIIY